MKLTETRNETLPDYRLEEETLHTPPSTINFTGWGIALLPVEYQNRELTQDYITELVNRYLPNFREMPFERKLSAFVAFFGGTNEEALRWFLTNTTDGEREEFYLPFINQAFELLNGREL